MDKIVSSRLKTKSATVLALLAAPAIAVETNITPVVSSHFYHVVEGERDGSELKDVQAWTISPSLSLGFNGPVWKGNWLFEHNEIKQVKSEFNDTRYSNISLSNTFSWWQDRIKLSANANRRNQNINRGQSGISDPIFSNQEFIDVDSLNLSLSFSNRSNANIQTRLEVSASETDFDERDLEQTESQSTSINKGGRQTANLTVFRNARTSQVKGGFSASVSQFQRDNRGDQKTSSINMEFGFPVWSSFDFVINGFKSTTSVENSSLIASELDNENYGAGLSWRFGHQSYLAVTRNRSNRGEQDEFTQFQFSFLPNDRTRVSLQKSERFYGEAYDAQINYATQRLSLTMTYGEELSSRTRLVASAESAGNFLCPVDVVTQEDCQSISVFPDIIPDDFFVTEFFRTVYDLDEEVVLNRSANAVLRYRFKKADVSLNYSRRESEYLERFSVLDTETVGLGFSHKMTRRNTLILNANHSRTMDRTSTQYRSGYKVTASFERRLTRKATGRISLNKISNTSNTGLQDRKDTRVEVQYSYKF